MSEDKTAIYDAVTIEPGMSIAKLIFLLSKSLEASDGSATIVGHMVMPSRNFSQGTADFDDMGRGSAYVLPDEHRKLELCICVKE